MSKVTFLLYTSELTFLLGLPSFVWPSPSRKSEIVRIILTIVRLGLLVACLFFKFLWIGLGLLLASLTLYLFEALLVSFTPSPKTMQRMGLAYVVAYFSIVNFILDRPGFLDGRPFAHWFIIILNIVIAVYLAGTFTFRLDYHRAWACYGTASYSELDGGTCNSHIDNEQSLHCVDAFSKGADAVALCLNPPPLNMDVTWHVVFHILTASAGIYFGTLPGRLKYLQNKKLD